MQTYTDIVKRIVELEEELGLYQYKVYGVPLWDIIRGKYRNNYVIKCLGMTQASYQKKHSIFIFLKSFLLSFWQGLKLFLLSGPKETIFYGFPRLERINGYYIDKFVEPLITETNIKESYLYLEAGKGGVHKTPRQIDNVVWVESINIISWLVGVVYSPLYFLLNYRALSQLNSKVQSTFFSSWKDYLYLVLFTSQFFVKTILIYLLFKRVKAKRIIAPTMSIEHVVPARWCKMKSYELQHGITTDLTTTYSGVFSPESHADLFLSFGESSMNPYFGFPIEKMYNIGYAFKQYLNNSPIKQFSSNTFLVLSDPEISDKIVSTLELFSNMYPDFVFHMRLHPLEELTSNQKERLTKAHVEIADNTVNSMLAIMSYYAVIGVNTTVLYEAISLGVKAAYISFNGLNPDDYPNPLQKEFFFRLGSCEDLKRFQKEYQLSSEQRNYFFSDFNPIRFYQIVGL